MAAAQDIRLITSESVTEGHPDKVCDQISDAILDELLKKDSSSHVAVETCATTGQFLVFGEITSEGYVNINQIVRETLERIGYTSSDIGLDAGSAGVLVSINEQSPEINAGVSRQAATQEERYAVQGAGDQGIMFGYACDETDAFMPLPIELAHRLAERLAYVRKKGIVAHLRPDGKTQVTVEYDGSGVPRRVDTIVISAQHDPEVSQGWLRDELIRNVIRPVLDSTLASCRGGTVRHDDYRLLVNPTGSFVLGGPAADAGLTGRKIIVDTYGGVGHHGGGAFSGKDPSKVDRSAAYAARWIAKNIVAAGLAHKAEVQLAYAIGVAEPVSVTVDTMGTGTEPGITDPVLAQAVRQVFDLRPAAVIDELDLLRPIYSKTAAYGHFGRADEGFTWEQIDKAGELREAALSAARQQ
ncbi:methionine adenosyltransferase [Scardovia wiggsiae]|uniref:methionine adenosyltransferase n=1 Tax=Scardovia wiggsiae TaxID=230143 RepID=UPI0036070297